MGRKCKLCTATQEIREEIEDLIKEGSSYESAADRAKMIGLEITHTSIERHWTKHVLKTETGKVSISNQNLADLCNKSISELRDMAGHAQAKSIAVKWMDIYAKTERGEYVSAREMKALQDLSPAIREVSERYLSDNGSNKDTRRYDEEKLKKARALYGLYDDAETDDETEADDET
ncbi:MAG: hypothetical protein GY862_06890 [Gammaproteobacteria bacterium]|nr:hypothetical protein [Gammaproteobacteria bacterium]